ncbi:MAG: sulfatase-like hydrolase/transferase [Lentisphaeraceae bacterium]|nr:sulfatase-like hydrolase/transferase [Lentisphaeraceae bacterium]
MYKILRHSCLYLIAFASFTLNAENKQANIILIIADDLGYGELGCQGNPQIPTPNIDALAAGGVRFTKGYVSGPYCSASRAAIMTGRYQTRFGYEKNPIGHHNENPNIGLPSREWTIGEQLQRSGYTTGLIGKWHLGGAAEFHPMRQGFDEFFGFMHEGHYFVPEPYKGVTNMIRKKVLPGLVKGRWTSKDGKMILTDHMGHDEPDYNANNPILRSSQPVDEQDYLTDAFTREGIDFIERNADRPFFLTMSYNAVHSPLQGLEDDMKKFSHIKDIQRQIFAAMLHNLDENVGKLTNKLKELKIEDNTLIVFLSDNGGPTKELTSSNLPLRGGKGNLYEGGIRVPFIMKWAGTLPAGEVYEKAILSTDIYATATTLSGQKLMTKDKKDGVNLIPYLTGKNTAAPHESIFYRFLENGALIKGDWKILRHKLKKGQSTSWALYNLKEDIGESKDLAQQNPAKLKELIADWEKLNSEMVEPAW